MKKTELEGSLKAYKHLTIFFALAFGFSLCFNIYGDYEYRILKESNELLTKNVDPKKSHMKVYWQIGDIQQSGWIPRDADVLRCDGSIGFEYLDKSGSIGIRKQSEQEAIDTIDKESVPYDGPWTTEKRYLEFFFDGPKSIGFLMK